MNNKIVDLNKIQRVVKEEKNQTPVETINYQKILNIRTVLDEAVLKSQIISAKLIENIIIDGADFEEKSIKRALNFCDKLNALLEQSERLLMYEMDIASIRDFYQFDQ